SSLDAGGARTGNFAAARPSPPPRPRAARNSQRVQKPRLQDRSCGCGSRGPAENRNLRGAMGCPPHARAASESIANAPTAADRLSGAYVRYTMSAFGGKAECAVRYSFIVMDLHHLLFAGLPGYG